MPRKKKFPSRKQVNFRLDLETYKTLKRRAKESKTTLTDIVVSLIKKGSL